MIPVPDSLGKEAFFIGVFTSRGNLKDHWMLISATPVLGIRSFVGILALPFRPLYINMNLLSFRRFCTVSHFNYSRMPVILAVSRL